MFSCVAYATNARIVMDYEYAKAYFNLYPNYLTAEGPINTKDQLLDVVDYYHTAGIIVRLSVSARALIR